MAFNVSTPIAFDAAATTDAASWAAAPVARRVSNMTAIDIVLSRIVFLPLIPTLETICRARNTW